MRASLLKISTLAKIYKMKNYAKFQPDKNSNFRFILNKISTLETGARFDPWDRTITLSEIRPKFPKEKVRKHTQHVYILSMSNS